VRAEGRNVEDFREEADVKAIDSATLGMLWHIFDAREDGCGPRYERLALQPPPMLDDQLVGRTSSAFARTRGRFGEEIAFTRPAVIHNPPPVVAGSMHGQAGGRGLLGIRPGGRALHVAFRWKMLATDGLLRHGYFA